MLDRECVTWVDATLVPLDTSLNQEDVDGSLASPADPDFKAAEAGYEAEGSQQL